MASTALENLPGVQNVAKPDLAALKRKMKEQAGKLSKLSKTSGGRGERVEAIVFKRLAPLSSNSGKARPTKLIIMVVSPTVEIEVIRSKADAEDEEKNRGISTCKVERGGVYYYGAFDLSSNVQEGCRIVLRNPRGEVYQGRLSLGGGAELKEKASMQVLTSLDAECYRLPTLENMNTHSNLLIPVNVEHLEQTVRAFTVGFDDPNVYMNQDRTDPENKTLGAYVMDSKGYPFTVSWNNADGTSTQTALVNVRMYENHLVNFGICDLKVWVSLAPTLMETFVGCIAGYVNKDVSNGMDINHGAEVEGCPYEYGLTITASALHVDMAQTVKRAGFRVSSDYVLQHFDDEQFLESSFYDRNVLNKDRDKGSVVNLSEYTGKLAPFTGDTEVWAFYAVVNTSGIKEEIVSELREEASMEEREQVLLGEKDLDGTKLGGQPAVRPQYIFAVKQ